MKNYSFTLTVNCEEWDDSIVEKLYPSMSDATLSSSCNKAVADIDREADSLGEAIESAIRDMQNVGLKVIGLEVESKEQEEKV